MSADEWRAQPAPLLHPLRAELRTTEYSVEICELYQRGALHAEVELTGRLERSTAAVDRAGVMRGIDGARAEESARRLRLPVAS
ncbi:MAG: hypothetical protein ABIR94_14400 [Rubrivivax sp.]